MGKDLLDLYNICIVDKSDMNKIRTYVNAEYAFASKKDKLTMFSNELNKLLDKSLNGLSYSLKTKVKNRLLFEFVSGNISQISLGRALDEILKLGSSEELTRLENWFLKSTSVDFYNPSVTYMLKEKMMNFESIQEKKEVHIYKNLIKEKLLISIKNLYKPSFFKAINLKIISTLIVFLIITTFAYNMIKKASYSEYELDFYTLSSIVQIDKEKHLKIITDIIEEDYISESYGIPKYFEYRDVDTEKLLVYLHNRNSLIADDDRYKIIIEVAKDSNLNPLLLFAIIGQEQGFVDRDNPYSNQIINNPFNVYNSWLDYNTNMRDSTKIAANTIVKKLQNRPKGLDPFLWINSTYAEDDRWWIGVKSLYYLLETRVGE